MLFKKKDSNSSSQAKTTLFASKAKKSDAAEKEDMRKSVIAESATQETSSSTPAIKVTVAAGKTSAEILRNPRITEKATTVAGNNVYTFDVARTANKQQIAEAVKDVYRVTPVAVRVVTIPTKRVMSRRGTRGTTGGGKKAYIQLKKGDTIELV